MSRALQIFTFLAAMLSLVPRAAAMADDRAVAKKPRQYRIDLDVNPAAPFPFLQKFGLFTVSVYPHGVRAEAPLVSAFSRNGSSTVTIQNRVARLYFDLPIKEVRPMLLSMSGSEGEVMPGLVEPPLDPIVYVGTVNGVAAKRYRINLGSEATLDIWTSPTIPKNAQFDRLLRELIGAISKPAAKIPSKIPGMPLYVELNTRRFRKLQLLKLKALSLDVSKEPEALAVDSYMLPAPLIDKLFR